MSRILIIEDDNALRELLLYFFDKAGYFVDESSTGSDGLELLKKNSYDLIITDMKLGDINGMEVIEKAEELAPTSEIILITAYGTIETAVHAIKKGAYNFITKPFEMDELLRIVDKALEKQKLVKKVESYENELKVRYKFEEIIGSSPEMINILTTITKVCSTDSTVLITGESGTGKELIAKAIHYNSPRTANPLVILNCGAIPENLHESELFGHVKGAFTGATYDKTGLFEEADSGTILLDEIGELSLSAQVKLLRFLQSREIRKVGETTSKVVNVRIVAMTNKDLKEEVHADRFREDLFFRLNVIPIYIPPIRDRRADIPLLVDYFINIHCEKLKKPRITISRRAWNFLNNYNWPGNVREVENLVERLMILNEGLEIKANMLPPEITDESMEDTYNPLNSKMSLKEVEERYILDVLNHLSWNKQKAVEWLGISRSSLYNKLNSLNIKDK